MYYLLVTNIFCILLQILGVLKTFFIYNIFTSSRIRFFIIQVLTISSWMSDICACLSFKSLHVCPLSHYCSTNSMSCLFKICFIRPMFYFCWLVVIHILMSLHEVLKWRRKIIYCM